MLRLHTLQVYVVCPREGYRSGGQALSWMLGVPGAGSCLLEVTVPYSAAAFDEKLVAGPAVPSYVSREAAEGLARDAYARAVALCVAGSDAGPQALLDKRVVGVGSTAAVVSSSPKRGQHRCFVCTQTKDGFAHYELNMAKGRRDRSGEDNAVSRVVLQAIAESVGVTVPRQFKRHHLFLDPRGHVGAAAGDGAVSEAAGASGQESALEGEEDGEGGVMEVMPVAELSPECDAIEDLVSGRSSAMMIVPRGPPGVSTTRGGSGSGSGKSSNAGTSGAAAPEDFPENLGSRPEGRSKAAAETAAVVLQDYAVKAALPRGATVVLPGSYNPLHKGHLGLLEAARRSLSDKLQAEAVTAGATAAAAAAATAAGHSGGHKSGSVGEGRKSWAAAVTPAPGVGVSTTVHAVFELSVANADKGGLPAEEVRRRARQFCEERGVGWPHPLIISRAPLFSQKARLFPGCAFVVGADTAKRVVDPKYYGNSQVEMVAALAEIGHLGCSFIVGGREDMDGRFLTLEGVLDKSGLPASLRAMFHGLDESEFRENLSSTSIRASAANANPK
eukprot:jgi/Undpi1/10460/HiC_scaffold_29.g12910.m1